MFTNKKDRMKFKNERVLDYGISENNYGVRCLYSWWVKTDRDLYCSAQWRYEFPDQAKKALKIVLKNGC